MIWGMTESTFTLVHVLLSLLGIGSGVVVMFGLLTGKQLDGWTVLFLATTVATSVGSVVPYSIPRRRRSQKPIASQVHWRQRVDSAITSSRMGHLLDALALYLVYLFYRQFEVLRFRGMAHGSARI